MAQRLVTYCVVPARLAAELHELLREYWREDPSFEVVVERRSTDRRAGERRSLTAQPPDEERRRLSRRAGRRVADRRVVIHQVPPPVMPRAARRHARHLRFVQRLAPTDTATLDLESQRLVIRFQGGDRTAMELLYMQHFDGVYRYIQLMVRDEHEAEDLTQQVFTKVLTRIHCYEQRPGVPFRGWLFRVAHNTVIDALRRSQRIIVDDAATAQALHDNDHAFEDVPSLIHSLKESELTLLLRRLPDAQRDVLILRFVLDMSTEEISQVTGRTGKAVRQLQLRGLRSLATWLMAMSQHASRRQRAPMLIRMRPAPILAARRFAIGTGGAGRRPQSWT